MHLARFIRLHSEDILAEWESFARTLLPAAGSLDVAALRDSAKELLEAVAVDLETPETSEETFLRGTGRKPGARTGCSTAATAHGAARAERGFSLQQLFSEFRALRASVTRLWGQQKPRADREHMDELIRFDAAIDEALGQSIARYEADLARSRDLFLGILGHDLRNPLSAITMSAERIRATDENTANIILKSGERMKKMIDALLDLTRTHLGGGIPITRSTVDLGALCSDAVAEIAVSHPERHLRCEPLGDLRGEWDADRIRQVLSNLIGNAVQYGAAEGPITVSARGYSDAAVVSVHNLGPAIDPSMLEAIFSPMTRGEESRGEPEGLGLGLYIASEIVEAHRGSIRVESSEEAGTTFVVVLPRHDGPRVAREPRAPMP